jgi:hypothetical protein
MVVAASTFRVLASALLSATPQSTRLLLILPQQCPKMPICITCAATVSHLYTTYSKADDRSLGKGVRLTQCPRCKRFADKYVEHDFVVLFIDLVLIKPQVLHSRAKLQRELF